MRFVISSVAPPLTAAGSSPSASSSCSRPKPATHGSSTRPTTSPHGSPPEPIDIEETNTTFAIAWPGNYQVDGPAFVYSDRRTGRVSTILGYATQILIAADES
jgi:hypothetical protein